MDATHAATTEGLTHPPQWPWATASPPHPGCRGARLERPMPCPVREVAAGADAGPLRLDGLPDGRVEGLPVRHSSRGAGPDAAPLALAPYRLRRVLDFIENRLSDDIGMTELAGAAGSSQAHFSRAFRAATGCSPYRYLVGRRIEKAKVMLLTGRDPLAVVAAACGFHSQHQFAAAFKRLVGIGPKRFGGVRTRR